MSQKSNKSAIGLFISLLVGLLLAKALWVFVELKYLPKEGVETEKTSTLKKLYYHYNLASQKEKPKPIVKNHKPVVKKVKPVVKPKAPEEFTKFTLKGLYNSKARKVIIVEYKAKSYALALNEELQGYKFVKLTPKYALFKKGGKKYKLELYKKKKEHKQKRQIEKTVTAIAPQNTQEAPKEEKKEEPVVEGGVTYIPKNLFNKYKGDYGAVRRNIDAIPYMQNGKLSGFKISFVKKGSDFSKLGLKRGDILTAVNGEPLNNFKVPLELFNNAESLNALSLTVKRGNEIKELEYEVR